MRTRVPAASAEVVLANLPPYNTQPWLAMGVVLHYALLAEAGVRVRIARPLDPPFSVPPGVALASDLTFLFDASLHERLARMEAEHRASPAFFGELAGRLAAGGERIVALSVWRNNVDVSLHVAALIKRSRPEVRIVLGGPEAIEDPASLLLPFVDAVVGLDAESVIVPLVAAALEDRWPDVGRLRNVWTHGSRGASPPEMRSPSPRPALPRIPFAALTPLLVGDATPTMPLLLNWGCPYRCSFCSNSNVYGRFAAGGVERVLEECDEIDAAWSAAHPGTPPGLNLQLSDATTNALPAQFDELLRGLAMRRGRWRSEPYVRGQTLVDHRFTDERVARMRDANFASTFFGLETASDPLRKALGKPGTIAQVAEGMRALHRGGFRGLHYGIPVGIPGETEADFEATMRFVEWTLTLGDTVESITVLPYSFFLTAQDPGLLGSNRGARRGLLWRTDGPAGDPAERARRTMRLFELLRGRANAVSPFPPALALPAMLSGEEVQGLDAWLDDHGRAFDQLNVRPVRPSPPHGAMWDDVDRRLGAAAPTGWTLEALAWARGAPVGRVAVFRRAEHRVALSVELRDPSRKAFAHTDAFNISYLDRWDGHACGYDADLVRACVRALGPR